MYYESFTHITTEVLQILHSEWQTCSYYQFGWWHENVLASNRQHVQGRVAYMPPVEAFTTRIKIFWSAKTILDHLMVPFWSSWSLDKDATSRKYHFCILDCLLMVWYRFHFDQTSVDILLMITMSSKSASIHLKVAWEQGNTQLKVILCYALLYYIVGWSDHGQIIFSADLLPICSSCVCSCFQKKAW